MTNVATGQSIYQAFEPLNFLEGGDQVAGVVRVESTVRETGKSIDETEIHLWTFDADGKVCAFRHHVDTQQHISAAP